LATLVSDAGVCVVAEKQLDEFFVVGFDCDVKRSFAELGENYSFGRKVWVSLVL
jgi:hypothetical protein